MKMANGNKKKIKIYGILFIDLLEKNQEWIDLKML